MADNHNPEGLAMLGMPHDKRPDMKELTRFLTRFCPLWVEIGLKLGLRQALLDVIKLDNPQRHRDCFRITLQNWLELNRGGDWKTLELAITNATRESKDLEALTMEEMLQKLVAPDGAQEQINGGIQDQRNGGAAMINPETAPTTNRGKGIVKDAVFAEAKRAICCIKSPVMTGTGFIGYAKCGEEKYCTLLVTNNHVIKTFDDAMGSQIIFESVFSDYNITLEGSEICKDNSFWYSPKSELDYALIEIDEDKLVDPKTKKSLDISPMQLIRPADIKDGDQIYVIQHPRGEHLAFSSSDSIVIHPLLIYQCTTDLGSSGSPVLKEVDGELKVVALHRGGREANVDCFGYNGGTLLHEILNHLNGRPAPPLPTNNTIQEALRRNQKY